MKLIAADHKMNVNKTKSLVILSKAKDLCNSTARPAPSPLERFGLIRENPRKSAAKSL
jgi:hypothetical protein